MEINDKLSWHKGHKRVTKHHGCEFVLVLVLVLSFLCFGINGKTFPFISATQQAMPRKIDGKWRTGFSKLNSLCIPDCNQHTALKYRRILLIQYFLAFTKFDLAT